MLLLLDLWPDQKQPRFPRAPSSSTMARAAAVHVDASGSLSYVSKGRPAAWRAAARRRGSRPAAGAISAVCADIQEGCARSMRPGLRVRLGLGRAGCLNESGWSTAAATAMITAPSTAANVSQRDGDSSGPGQQFRVRSARRWRRWR